MYFNYQHTKNETLIQAQYLYFLKRNFMHAIILQQMKLNLIFNFYGSYQDQLNILNSSHFKYMEIIVKN